jgi:hypothetical protein
MMVLTTMSVRSDLDSARIVTSGGVVTYRTGTAGQIWSVARREPTRYCKQARP